MHHDDVIRPRDEGMPVDVRILMEFLCPFCAVAVRAVEATDEHGAMAPGVIHQMPACAKFMAMAPEEYLRVVGSRLQN